jgi:hypothetical protein
MYCIFPDLSMQRKENEREETRRTTHTHGAIIQKIYVLAPGEYSLGTRYIRYLYRGQNGLLDTKLQNYLKLVETFVLTNPSDF